MKPKPNLFWILTLAFMVGCSTLYQSTVTLTEVVDSASNEYAKVFNAGLVSKPVDEQVTKAHGEYQKAAGVAAGALRAYKLSGDVNDYNKAFAEALKTANEFVNMIVPLISNDKATKLKTDLNKVSTL
jgi:hypothetical protein